jgi:outer membrane protein assembly factor BamB
MSRRLVLAIVVLGLAATSARAQATRSFTRSIVPSRTSLARLGLERQWSGIVPLGHGSERLLLISQAGGFLFAQTSLSNFHCYDAETGRHLWGLTLSRPMHGAQGVALPQPTSDARPAAVNSDRVFVTNSTTLYTLDKSTGRIIWTKDLEELPASATAADEELVLVGLRTGKLVATTVRDHSKDRPPGLSAGTFAWAWKTNAPLTGRPIPSKHVVAFASQDKRVYVAIHEPPPRLLWRYLTAGPVSASMGTHGTRTLLVPSEDNNLYAVDLFLAETKWVFASGAPIVQEPLATGPDCFVINKAGRLTALDIENGEVHWDLMTPHGRLQAISAKRVYLRSYDGDLMIVDRASGQLLADARTTHDRGGLNLRDYTIGLPNYVNDRLYYATASGALLCLREAGQTTPFALHDPKEPKFGEVPVAGAAPVATTPEPEPKPDAGDDEPKKDAGDEDKPKDEPKSEDGA